MEDNNNIYVHYFTKPTDHISKNIYCCEPDDIGPVDNNYSFNLLCTFLPWKREIDDDFMVVHLN